MSHSNSHINIGVDDGASSGSQEQDKTKDKDKGKEAENDNRRHSLLESSYLESASATEAQKGMWKIIHRKQKRRGASIELVLHLLFTIIFVIIIFLQRGVYGSYLMNQGLYTALVTQQISVEKQPFPTTFRDIGSWDQIADYLTTVLGPALDLNESYSGAPYTSDRLNYVQYNNRLVGGIRLRQLRTRKCNKIPQEMDKLSLSCYYNLYEDETRDREPYGPNNMYTFTDSDEHNASVSLWGYAAGWYEGGGYITDIPQPTPEQRKAAGGQYYTNELQKLIDNDWWDQSTRVIVISLCTLNPALDAKLSVLYLMLEFTAGGMVTPTAVTKVFRVNLYFNGEDIFRAICEVIFIILLGYWMYEEVNEFRKIFKKRNSILAYFTSMWNVLEMINLVAFWTTIIMYLVFLASDDRNLKFIAQPSYHPELEVLASQATNYYNISAFNILICSFRTFKYFRLNDRLFVLWKALALASSDIFSFLVMFFVLLFGFILFGLISFGNDVTVFNTFASAWGSCWNFVLGNPPDYTSLSNSNRVLGPMFFLMFTVFVVFILVNMFVAILSEALVEVHKAKPPSKGVTHAVKRKLFRLVSNLKKIKTRKTYRPSKDLVENMQDPSVLNKESVTLDEMKTAIGPGATDSQAKKLISIHEKMRSGYRTDEYEKDIPLAILGETNRNSDRLTKRLSPQKNGSNSNSPRIDNNNNTTTNDDVSKLKEENAILHQKLDNMNKKLDNLTELLQKRK